MITKVGGLILLLLCFGCGAPQDAEPEPYKPLPSETERIDVTPECRAACEHLREMQCGYDDVNPCEDWLCAAEFQDFQAIAKAEACPL